MAAFKALLLPHVMCCASSSSSSSSFRDSARSAKMTAREAFSARPVDEEARRYETSRRRRRRQEDDLKDRNVERYRGITSGLTNYPQEEVKAAKRLVARLIKSGEEIEEMIVEAADNGDLNPVVLVVIKTRLEIARQDDERDIVQALDLLYRRIEYEIMKRESSKAMRLLNDLLNLNDGSDHQGWLRRARHMMLKTFIPETPFTIPMPQLSKQADEEEPEEEELLRIDFIREVNELIAETESEAEAEVEAEAGQAGLDPDSVAARLKHADKMRNLQLVKDLRDLAAILRW